MAKKKKDEIVATIGLDGKIVKNNDKQNKNIVADVDYEGNIRPYAPAPSVNNNRNNSFVSSLMNTQNDVFSKVMTFQNQQPSILEEDNSLEGYKDTGKKYGDYYYENYGLFKDTPIYVKNNKYYVNTNGSYQELGNLDKNGNVITGNVMTSKEAEKQKLEDAKKLGYKDNSFKVTSQEYDDIQSSFKKLKKEYKLSDKELQDFIDNGNLTTKHIRIQDKKSDKIRRDAIESREKLASGKVKQYSDNGLKIKDRIYMDTHDMSDDEKTKYINYITRKRQPEDENKSSFFKTSDVWKDGYDFGDVTKTIVGTGLNPVYSTTKGISNFVEGTSDTISNIVGTGLEKVGSINNKKQDVTETKNGREYIGYRYGNKNYWYDKKSDRMYDENWNELESFNIDTFQKRYTNTNKVAEFGRQMKEQSVNDDTSEVMEVVGKPIKKASVFGDKSNAMFESLGQALPLMAAGNSAGGLLGEKAAVASTSALTFANTYGSAKTTAIRNGASESDAGKSAFIQAAAETISEQFFDSIPGAKSAGWGEKAVGKISSGVEKYFGTQTGKVVAKTLDISGEGFEEIISNMITAGGNDIFHAFDKNFNYGMEGQTGNIAKDMANAMLSQDSVDSFVCAIITSAILNGGSTKLNNAQMNNIVSTYAKENNISVNEARIKLDLDSNIEGEEKYSYSNKIPTVIKYEQTDNAKINNFRQSAVNEKMINSKKTQDFMNLVESVISDKDYNIIFDSTITNGKGTVVDGKISLNNSGEAEIRLNPQSDRAAEFLLTHEITHAIETKELRGIILDYAKKNPEFKSALKDLQKTYGTTNVNDEVVADISAQILGNQEFINSLSAQSTPQSRNIIKNIYESIKRVLNNFTSKGRYRNFVNDLEIKWREAYKMATTETVENNLNNNKYFSKGKLITGEDIVISDDTNGSKPNNKVAEQTLKNMLGIKYINESNNKEISIEKKDIKKYLNDGYHNYKNSKLKKRIAGNYGEVIELAKINSSKSNYKNTNRGKQGYDYYNANLAYPIKDSKGNIKDYKYYEARLVVRKDNNNNYAYDLDNFSEKKGAALDKSSLSIMAGKPASSSFSSNNVSQSNKNVKLDTSTKYSMQSKENNTHELDNSSFSLKEKQLEIIKKENPMLDDYHTGIRTIDDIKTPEEAFKTKIDEDEDYSYPDFTQEDGEKALESGRITVYSSQEIKQGTFVSPSKSMAQDYAGDGKIFEQTISINDVAWINSDEGQYAKIVSNDNNTINEPKLSQDNKGRTLSKEQQEFFKDSKIRNENGNLKVMYHGTKNGGFTIFDRNKAKTSGNFGTGIYFSSTMDYSNDYIDKSSNSKMYEVYLNITNPVDSVNKSRTLTNEQVKKLVETIANNEEYGIENYGYNATIDSVTNDLIQHNNDFEIFQDLDITCVGNFAELVELANKTIETTFDGINTPLETVAFYPNQIKNIDNTNPTTNDDIRYSQKAPTWQEHLEKNYKATGTRTYFDEMTNTTKKAIAPISNEVKKISNEIKELKKEISERKIPIAKEYQKNTINSEEYNNYFDNLGIPKYYENSIDDKSLKSLSRNMSKELDLNRHQTKELEEVIKNTISNENINKQELFNNIKDRFSEKSIETKIDEIRDLKRSIANTKIRVSEEVKNSIADYYKLKQRNFRKVQLASNDGISIDSAYQELSDTYPEYFSDDILNDADKLLAIIDAANLDSVYNEKYILPDSEIQNVANYIYDSLYEYRNSQKLKAANDEIKNLYKEEDARKTPRSNKEIPKDPTKEASYDVPERLTRKEVKKQLLDEMEITAEDLSVGDDIKALNFQLTDPIRVNEKVFGWKLGKKVNEATIEKTKHNEAERTRWLNKERDSIKELGIKPRSKESAAVQKYGEGKYVDEYGDVVPYGDINLINEFPNVKTQEKIKKAAEVLRNKYDSYLIQINNVLTSLGYDAIPQREDYMRHFQELTDVFSQTGIPFNLNDMQAEDLPTDINGLTEFNKPGKNWFASAQKRTGIKTTYDAITGIDGYLEGASNLIYHTADIQRYRALSGLIRDSFGKTKGFDNLDGLTDEQVAKRIKDIQSNKFSKYAAWLDEQANMLANKKGAIDRGVERFLGRRGYTFLNTIKKQVGSNMTGFNVRSAMTNFISSTIASSKTKKLAMVKGTISTVKNMFHKDGFINKSDFLTSRFGSDSLSAKFWQKASNAGQIFMNGSDYFTANQIVRSKYYEGLQKGMTESEAIKYADDFGSRVMGDRSKGMMPEAFNSKTLGLFTQFQLETNNQWQYMVHDTKMDFQKNSAINGGLKAGATMLFQMGQLAAYSYLFNELFEQLTESRAAFDPVDIIKKLFGLGDDDDDKSFEERMKSAGSELVDAIPFASLFGSGGRMPISDALKPFETSIDYVTGKKNSYGGDITLKDVGRDIRKTLPYYILPTGYSQIKKTTKGLSMFSKDKDVKGSYTESGNLRFPVANTTAKKIQAGLFGEYASKEARDYFDNSRKALKENQQQMYQTLNVPVDEYWSINKEINSLKTKLKGKSTNVRQDKIFNYIDDLDISNTKKSILKKSIYKSYKEDDDKIKNYINNSKMSKTNKKSILKRLGLDK